MRHGLDRIVLVVVMVSGSTSLSLCLFRQFALMLHVCPSSVVLLLVRGPRPSGHVLGFVTYCGIEGLVLGHLVAHGDQNSFCHTILRCTHIDGDFVGLNDRNLNARRSTG